MNTLTNLCKSFLLHFGANENNRTCIVAGYEPVSPRLKELNKKA